MVSSGAERELDNLQRLLEPVQMRLAKLEAEVAPYKATKKELAAAKAKLEKFQQSFAQRLEDAQAGLDSEQTKALVLGILKGDLGRELDRRVAAHRQAVVSAVENWWNKYRVTLRDIEAERDAAKGRLDGFLEELGYATA